MADFSIDGLLADYRAGRRRPRDVIASVIATIRAQDDANAWISTTDDARLESLLAHLDTTPMSKLPLYGIPFAVKDNIDVAGCPTTAGCTAYAFVPEHDAFVVARLVEAGAIPVGKTNMDQFATGLVGTRSPYGACRNPFNPEYISGGSSAGSAIAVATGQVSFALGTDTAGSGRVPAAFNNIIGLKPTCGLLSMQGVVPACRSLDVVSVFAMTAADAQTVLNVAAAVDASDPYSRAFQPPARSTPATQQRFRFGVPQAAQLEYFGDEDMQRLFAASVKRLANLGGAAVEIDLQPFLDAATLLYEGPWVAERFAAVGEFIDSQPDAVLPVIRQIIGGGARFSAVDAFRAEYRLRALRRISEQVWNDVDLIVTPTTPTIYRISEVEADPVTLNSRLGRYTNFMNLLDLAAVAVPAGFRGDGLPLGVTLFAPAFHDHDLLRVADRLHRAAKVPVGATGRSLSAKDVLPMQAGDIGIQPVHASDTDVSPLHTGGTVEIAVCGAHMKGLPLNAQLTDRGAQLLAVTRSAPEYRLYALPGGPPQRPGMVRVATGGAAIELEVWRMPVARFGDFVAGIPAPLAIGRVRLTDGSEVSGFVCESVAVPEAADITHYGGWRGYVRNA
jgi:allophanate hydrolase